MALRVLLADESTTIKKVMQLALQDFAIDVKAVHAGVDVLEVARTFQPDIVFADILLQKKNGYEVCSDLKNDSKLKEIPVVLMWSSFMEFDEALAVKNKAEGRLEKPFDVEVLRKLILELVPKTRSQRLAHFLEFSDKVTEPMRAEAQSKSAAPAPAEKIAPPPPPPPIPPPAKREEPGPSTWNMDSFEDVEADDDQFSPLNLSGLQQKPAAPDTPPSAKPLPANEDREPWSHQDLSRFKIDLPPVSVATDDLDFKIDLGEDEFTTSDFGAKRPPPPPEPATHVTHPTVKIEKPVEDDTFSLYSSKPPGPADYSTPEIPVFEAPIEPFDLEVETSEPATPISPLRFEPLGRSEEEDDVSSFGLSLDRTTLGAPVNSDIPQMDADRLEEIIRAQSRDIIEAVVRKIVPDLAETIIRAELERLLGDDGRDGDRKTERPSSP